MKKNQERVIKAILSNDEASTDEELISHFVNEVGVSNSEAVKMVSERNLYLRGERT